LANHFLGFNQWSTSILGLNQEEFSYDEATQSFRCQYVCKVKLILRDGRSTEVIGRATAAGKEKHTVVEFAKKNSLTDARKKAFQNLVIIRLKSKIAVHFLTDPID